MRPVVLDLPARRCTARPLLRDGVPGSPRSSHTATFLKASGADMKDIQELLGHSSITTSADTYTSVVHELETERAKAEAAAAIVPATARPALCGREYLVIPHGKTAGQNGGPDVAEPEPHSGSSRAGRNGFAGASSDDVRSDDMIVKRRQQFAISRWLLTVRGSPTLWCHQRTMGPLPFRPEGPPRWLRSRHDGRPRPAGSLGCSSYSTA